MSDDSRPLPDGWIKQWNEQYSTNFYVNTRASPPESSWVQCVPSPLLHLDWEAPAGMASVPPAR